jgi:hypothetical protein
MGISMVDELVDGLMSTADEVEKTREDFVPTYLSTAERLG